MTGGVDAVNEVLVGLVERGCTAAEALDYYMAGVGPYNQTEWAAVRGVSQQTVSENISKANAKLSESDTMGDVGQFTINEHMEEVHRRIVENLEFLNWTKFNVNNTYMILADGEHFTFDIVKSGKRSTDVIYRKDIGFSESGLEVLKTEFESSLNGGEGAKE